LNSVDQPGRTQVELWIGGTAVVLLGLGCLLVLRPFVSAALWALILCFTTWPLFLRLEDILGGRRTLSALIATLFLAAVIVVPVVILGATLADNVSALISASQKLIHEGPPSPPDWVSSIPMIGSHVADYWNHLGESSSVRLHELSRMLPAAKTIVLWGGGALAEGIFQITLSLLIAFFFLSRRTCRCQSTPRHVSSGRGRRRRSSSRSRRCNDSCGRLRNSRNLASSGRDRGGWFCYRRCPGLRNLGVRDVRTVPGTGRTTYRRGAGCLLAVSTRVSRLGGLHDGVGTDGRSTGQYC